jgi:hypothetical protein
MKAIRINNSQGVNWQNAQREQWNTPWPSAIDSTPFFIRNGMESCLAAYQNNFNNITVWTEDSSSFVWLSILTYSIGQTFLPTARLLRWLHPIFYAPNYYKSLTLMYCTVQLVPSLLLPNANRRLINCPCEDAHHIRTYIENSLQYLVGITTK